MNPPVLCSPPLDNYGPNSNWIPPNRQPVPMLMPMNNADQMQLHHRLSVNVTDHYEWTTNPTNYFSAYPPPVTTTNSSNIDAMSLNGSLSSNTSTNDSSSYPILAAPLPTVFLNPYPQQSPTEQQPSTFVQPTVYFPQQISPRLMHEQNDGTTNKFVSILFQIVHQ